jgi:hypothetical protein
MINLFEIRIMHQLTTKSAEKLQTILSKRCGRQLTLIELQESYNNLMEFAFALVELKSSFYKNNQTNTLNNLTFNQ